MTLVTLDSSNVLAAGSGNLTTEETRVAPHIQDCARDQVLGKEGLQMLPTIGWIICPPTLASGPNRVPSTLLVGFQSLYVLLGEAILGGRPARAKP